MKLFRLTSFYPVYIQDFYAKRPALEGQSYARQKAALDYDAFGEGDSWFHALTPLGYEVMEVAANAAPLQKAWAGEGGIAFTPDRWLWDIVSAQIIKFQPTLVFIDDFSTFSRQWLRELRQVCPSIRLILGWCGAPFQDPDVFQAYDVVLSCIPELVDRFRSMGHTSFHLHHAFDTRILARVPLTSQDIDFSFVGGINRGKGSHGQRERLLLALVRQVPLRIHTPNLAGSFQEEIKTFARGCLFLAFQALRRAGVSESSLGNLPKIGRAASWSYRPLFAVHPRLRPYAKPGVFGLEMYRTLRRSRLSFNSHTDIAVNSASNMRLFEATGVGSCLVTDWKANLSRLLEPDKEVVAYKSAGECVEKVKWLLAHPEASAAIAQAGQQRTLRDHTFAQRRVELDGIIKRSLG
jgi:spore maturation protein CgeB